MKNESASITTDITNSDTVRILLKGQLVIKNAKAIKEELASALNKYKYLEIVLKDVVKIDLACLQLLTAFQKSCFANEVNLSFNVELTDQVRHTLANSGFKNIFNGNFQKTI